MKNIEQEIRRGLRYGIPHAPRIHGNFVDDLRISAGYGEDAALFLKVQFIGRAGSLTMLKRSVMDSLLVEHDDIQEMSIDVLDLPLNVSR